MNTAVEALKLAKECGATTYTNRHYPDATAVTFSPLAWEKFCERARSAPVQEQALPEFYAQLEYNSPDWDVFACVYRRRADATPELVHREQLPRQTPAAPVHPVAPLLAAIQAEPVTLIHKWRVLELVKDHAAQPAVPDAITDNSKNPEYRAGWNECRETMLQILKARTL
jgi:hypothetical protein